jgi:hypothetical protein
MSYDFRFSYSESMKDIINQIIDICDKLEAEENVTIFEFGENRDLVLVLYKDCDYDRKEDIYNLVTISTRRNGEYVDDTGDIHVTDGSLYRELERIWNYKNLKTL